jgi:two-component system NtrC family sensor kinase
MDKFTILLVDDEVNVLKALKRLLLDTDYRILSAESGQDALRLFEEQEIHLVISDYRMPEMSGVELLNQIKQKYPETVRIVLSGYADAGAVVEAINEGQIYKFVPKPWNDQDLLTTITSSFEQYRLQKENARLYEELKIRYQELEVLSKCLEDKVAERTKNLEIKNRALSIAHSVIDSLPLGVVGIDSDGMIVYMNDSLKNFVDVDGVRLGGLAADSFAADILSLMGRVAESQRPAAEIIDAKNNIGFVCAPLQRGSGTIGVFSYLDLHRYTEAQAAGWAMSV